MLRIVVGVGCAFLAAQLLNAAPAHAQPIALELAHGMTHPATASGFSATATWNGADVSTATSVSTALPTSFGTLGNLTFRWSCNCPAPAIPLKIAHAHLQVLFFSQPTYSKDQSFSPGLAASNGSYSLISDLTETKYLLEGIFLLYCDLTDSNSNVIWSKTFYAHVTAPFHVTVANVGLVALAAYEVVQLVRVGPHALPKEKLKTKVEKETDAKGGS